MVVASSMGAGHPFRPAWLHGAVWQDDVVITNVVDPLAVAKPPATTLVDLVQKGRINVPTDVSVSGTVMDDDAPGHQREYPVGPRRAEADAKRSPCYGSERSNQQTLTALL